MRSSLPLTRTIVISSSADWLAWRCQRRRQPLRDTCRARDSSTDLNKVNMIWLSSQGKGGTKWREGRLAGVRAWRRRGRGGRGSWDRWWRSRLIMILTEWQQYKSNFIINSFIPLKSALGCEHSLFVFASLSIPGSYRRVQGFWPLSDPKWRQSCPN